MGGIVKRYIWLFAAFLVVLGLWRESILPRIQQTHELAKVCDQMQTTLDLWDQSAQDIGALLKDRTKKRGSTRTERERVDPRRRSWQRRTLPPGYPSSTIRAAELNDRVRDGNGCVLCAMATNN